MKHFILTFIVVLLTIPSFRSGSDVFVTLPNLNVVELSEWDYFVAALIWVESKGNPNAVGSCNDVGILQITPIYVAEVNRILGEELFTLDHRFDCIQSLYMFEIMQSYYNPEKDIDKAIKLHNPGAGSWYGDRIKARMKELQTFN